MKLIDQPNYLDSFIELVSGRYVAAIERKDNGTTITLVHPTDDRNEARKWVRENLRRAS